MAINPNDPNGSENGTPRNPAGPRPRATIVVKNNGGSGDKIQPVKPSQTAAVPPRPSVRQQVPTAGAPGASGRLPAATPSSSGRSGVIRAPGQSQRRTAAQLAADREALGLSAARPSEMVQGLDEFAKKAEAQAAREEAKRKSGGRMSATEALHVDDTGKRWSMLVKLGIAVAVLTLCAVGGVLLYRTAYPPLDPRVAYSETRTIMKDLAREAELMPHFDESEKLTPEAARMRLKEFIEGELKNVMAQIQRDKAAQRNPDPRLIARRDFIENMVKFKDAWNRPLAFSIDGDSDLVIASAPLAGKEVPPAERARVRSGAPEKTAEKSN